MRPFIPRALSAGRQAALCSPASQTTLAQRFSLLPTIQAASASFKAHAGYKLNPSERPINPNSKNKIPDRSRQIKRPFVPLPTKTDEELATMPYVVRRTPYSQLPIYRRWMSGGNRMLILIKKVEGDRRRLVDELAEELQLDKADIRLNPTTQHIEIKGNQFEKALDWLLAKGF
ncbi:Fc.00g016510.m01.CDS01 [Cosmosporella sp. VM-42]